MVVDTSALVAILLGEADGPVFLRRIYASPVRRISAVSVFEAAVVMQARKGPDSWQDLLRLLSTCALQVSPFDITQAQLAREAYGRFGKGRHPAGLNLGDCCAYALAKLSGEPLLFKGQDFHKTDVAVVE